MTLHFRFLLAAALFGCAPSAFGQAPPDSAVALPDMTVMATRVATATALAPVRATVLDGEAIAASASSSVADLLDARTPLFVKRYGDGGLASVSFRGTGASQTLVLLDGHRIADPQLGQLDLSLLPTILLESAEVVHGPGSALYGTDAIGGVVNLRTLAPGSAPVVRAMGGYGAYGEHTGSLLASLGQGKVSGVAAFEYDGAAGDFPYAAGTARESRRTGADRRRASLYSALGFRAGLHDLKVSGWYTDSERGLPTAAGTPPQGERQWDESFRLWADDRVQLSWGALHVGGLAQRSALRYQHPGLDVDDTGRTLISTLEADATGALGRHWLLSGGVSGSYAAADHPELGDGARDAQAGTFLSGTGSYGRLLLYPAVRADAYFVHDAGTRIALSPRIGLNLQPFESRELYLKASAARAFRVPTLNDRFWTPGGNPDLRPERGWNVDGGLFVQFDHSRAELTAFAGRTADEIVWLPASAGYWAPDNVARILRRGFEAGYHLNDLAVAGARLHGGLIYTFVQALDRSDPTSVAYGRQVRYVPREALKAYAGASLGPVRLDLNGRYTGRRYTSGGEQFFLDPYVVLDGQVRVEHQLKGLRMQLALAVENLLDARYAVVENYPMPPRHALLRLLIEAPFSNR